MSDTSGIEGADWPTFGWNDDVRPALAAALSAGGAAAGRALVLATLYRVTGSAPRGGGAQMLFDGARASGYFSGDCIEGDVARHAAEVLASGQRRVLHYGAGSPWIDIRLRCGGALHILLERIEPGSAAARSLLDHAKARTACCWVSTDAGQTVLPAQDAPLIAASGDPLHLVRRFDPARRVIVSGGDPGALALAALASQARFETVLVRPDGPQEGCPLPGVAYLRRTPAAALAQLGVDRWTAYIGATHEDHHDLPACLAAVRGGAVWAGMIGARSRAGDRQAALQALGASAAEVAAIRMSPGVAGLGKAPWEVAVGIMAEVMRALNPAENRA